MELTRQICIVSAFGRGHWMAAALVKENLKVALIDVTPRLGVWPSEDIQGPFGFFKTEKLSELRIQRMNADDAYTEVDRGFTLWLEKGPVEFKSPLTSFYFEKQGWDQAIYETLSLGKSSIAEKKKSTRAIAEDEFSRQWILHFSHQWNSTIFSPNATAVKTGSASPFLTNLCVRQSTRTGLEKSFNWLREQGVEVITEVEIRDLAFAAKNVISGLELQGQRSGLFKIDQLVWTLSSEETHFLNEKISSYLNKEKALEPEWCWLRYRVGMAETPETQILPHHLVILKDIYSPWTHENFLILQRTALPQMFDAWVRLPTVQRFNKEYLTYYGQAIVEILNSKMQLCRAEVKSYPQEYYYTYGQLGPGRHPVYAQSSLPHQNFKNVYFDSAETWASHSWDDMFLSQEKITQEISQWWKNLQLKLNKARQDKETNP